VIAHQKAKKRGNQIAEWLSEHLKGKSFRTIAADATNQKDTVCNSVNQLLKNLKTSWEITRELQPGNFKGNCIVDAKFIPVKEFAIEKPSFVPRSRKRRKILRGLTHISGCDYDTHDIPAALLTQTEEFWVYDIYFRQLKELHYPLCSLTCDDRESIRKACLQHFPAAKIQLCIRHYSEEISRKLKIRSIERTMQSLEKKLVSLKDDYLYETRPEAQLRAVQLLNHIADLEHRYWVAGTFSVMLQSLIRSKTRVQYEHFATELKEFFHALLPIEHPFLRKRIIAIYQKFQADREFLFTSLRFPDLRIPRTTNLLEGYHSHWESQLSSIRGFESTETAKNYMNALVLKKRFSVLVSCKKHFKHLNGRSPLEHSGGLQATLKDWVSFCIRKE